MLQGYTPGQSVVLTRRAGYDWGPADRANRGAAYLSGIDFKITPEPSVRTGVLTSGQVQGVDNVEPQDIATLCSGGYDVITRANPGIAFGLTFVQGNPIADQLQVRQAITDAIDSTAIEAFRPIYEGLASALRTSNFSLPGTSTIWDSYEVFLERSSALVGSPQQILDKVHRYYDALGQTVLAVGGHQRGLTRAQFVGSLELFQSDIAPQLRRSIPDPPWPEPAHPDGTA